MKARLIAVGEHPPGWVAEGFAEYRKRLSHWLPFDLVEVAPGVRGKGRDAARATHDEGQRVLAAPVMPGAQWFAGTQVNYARQVLRHADRSHAAGHPALVFQNERMAAPEPVTWPELQREVAVLATRLRALGVQPGDRIGIFAQNRPEWTLVDLAALTVRELAAPYCVACTMIAAYERDVRQVRAWLLASQW